MVDLWFTLFPGKNYLKTSNMYTIHVQLILKKCFPWIHRHCFHHMNNYLCKLVVFNIIFNLKEQSNVSSVPNNFESTFIVCKLFYKFIL